MENLDNKWVLSASSNDDCKEKDGNNPVTLGLENMRGVRLVIALHCWGGSQFSPVIA